jgi:segregation and condensation protein B
MDYFGINSPDDLPKIKEVLSGQLIEPTIINHTDFEQGSLVVTDNGELIGEVTNDENTTSPEAGVEEDVHEVNGAALFIEESGEEEEDETDESQAADAEEDEEDIEIDEASADPEELNEWREEIAEEENTDDVNANETDDRKRDEENNTGDEEDSDKESES